MFFLTCEEVLDPSDWDVLAIVAELDEVWSLVDGGWDVSIEDLIVKPVELCALLVVFSCAH